MAALVFLLGSPAFTHLFVLSLFATSLLIFVCVCLCVSADPWSASLDGSTAEVWIIRWDQDQLLMATRTQSSR